jgi:hypothetical protein
MLIRSQDNGLNVHDLTASYKDSDYVPSRLTLEFTRARKPAKPTGV